MVARMTFDTLRSRTSVDENGCWLWQGVISHNGYGRVGLNGKQEMAHRAAYQLQVGPIEDGKQLDHLCRNRRCVNPAHLEQVTPAENIRRGDTGSNHRSKTHCPRGHEYVPENTRWERVGNKRHCRSCDTRSNRGEP